MKKILKNNHFLLLALILLTAAIVRFYKLGEVPRGMTWDEAAIGYNGYAITTTRRDEWLERLPVSFKSFGDYKAPVAVYLTGPFTTFLGSEPWILRLPFAVSGVLAVLGAYWLIRIIFDDEKEKKSFALLAALLMALSPWHLFFARVGFESGLSLTLLVWSVVFFAKAQKSIKNHKGRAKVMVFYLLSVVLGVIGFYAYHSAKIFLPGLALLLLWHYRNRVKNSVVEIAVSGTLGLVLMLPIIKDSLWGNGLARARVSILSMNISSIDKIKLVTRQFFDHLSPDFLILGENMTLRHSDGQWGVFLPTTFVLLAILIPLIFYRFATKRKIDDNFWFFLIWIVLGILPAAVSYEVPHANRALLALPGFIGLAIIGLKWLTEFILSLGKDYEIIAKSFFGTFICVHVFFLSVFINNYFNNYNRISASDFNEGYLEAVDISQQYLNGANSKPKVSKVIFTTEYRQPYIFVLYANRLNPISYRGGALNSQYEFKSNILPEDLKRDDVLLVAGKSSPLDPEEAVHLVYDEANQIRFKIYYLPGKIDK